MQQAPSGSQGVPPPPRTAPGAPPHPPAGVKTTKTPSSFLIGPSSGQGGAKSDSLSRTNLSATQSVKWEMRAVGVTPPQTHTHTLPPHPPVASPLSSLRKMSALLTCSRPEPPLSPSPSAPVLCFPPPAGVGRQPESIRQSSASCSVCLPLVLFISFCPFRAQHFRDFGEGSSCLSHCLRGKKRDQTDAVAVSPWLPV